MGGYAMFPMTQCAPGEGIKAKGATLYPYVDSIHQSALSSDTRSLTKHLLIILCWKSRTGSQAVMGISRVTAHTGSQDQYCPIGLNVPQSLGLRGLRSPWECSELNKVPRTKLVHITSWLCKCMSKRLHGTTSSLVSQGLNLRPRNSLLTSLHSWLLLG